MNLNMYKEYRFTRGKLTSTQSGKVYKFRLDKSDRFYSYVKPYIEAGGVSGLTKLMVDCLVVENADKSFFDEKSFALNATILAKDKCDVVTAFGMTINNVKINCVDVSKLSYENGDLVCTLCEMEIPYHTEIDVSERVE